MAKIIANMPMLSLPVLAVGAFGAPLSDASQRDIRPQSAPLIAPDPDLASLPSVKPLPVQIDFALRPAEMNAAASRRFKAEMGKNERPLPVLETTGPALISSPAEAVSSVAVVAVSFTPPPSPPGQAVQIPKPPSMAYAVSASQVMAGLASAPGQRRSNQAIFGTSASNAYKVYYPQIDQSAPGGAAKDLQSFGDTADQDSRVLKKQGSYLFYDDAPQGGAAKMPKANGDTDAKKVASAGDKAEAQKAPPELTAPVLQKQPLDFEGSLFKSSTSAASTAASNANTAR